ncbi:MAG: outer membrane protein transport protein [Steroidobacteraceae bacterium]
MFNRLSPLVLRGAVLASLGIAAAGGVHATNGYFSDAYGVKAEGEAGAGIAFPQDALTIATNPAGLSAIPSSFDAGLDLFRPKRDATLVQGGAAQTFNGNDTGNFFIPSIGYVRRLAPNLAAGVALFGNGGLNTDYGSNPFARFGATGSAGVDLEQAFLSPALSWSVTPNQSLGIAANIAYQRFKAKGIGLFSGFSSDPAAVSDRGYDSSFGAGVRIGYIGHLNQYLAVGATWQSRTKMGRFKKYAGLFADQGEFDVPATYGVGLALTPTTAWTIALDWQEIKYSDVASVGNGINSLFSGVPLGATNGPGFGWRDVSVLKIGTTVNVNEQLTLRAGFSDNHQPIPASQTFFNVLAPGVVAAHITAGLSWRVSAQNELNLSVLHAIKKTVNGSGSLPPAFGGGEVNISLEENALGLGWSHHF